MDQTKRPIIVITRLIVALFCLVASSQLLAFPVSIMGDSRNDVRGILPKIVTETNKLEGVRFAIHLGDMTGGGAPKEFEHYRQVMSKLKVPVCAIPGNHERPKGNNYEKYLGDPYYSRREGRWRFIFIDNSRDSLGKDQFGWLRKQLKEAETEKEFVVMAMHKPVWCPAGGGHIMKGADRKTLLTLAEKHKVKLILAAHVHSYFKYVRNGTTHITTGGAGAPLVGRDSFFHYIIGDFNDDGTYKLQVVRM